VSIAFAGLYRDVRWEEDNVSLVRYVVSYAEASIRLGVVFYNYVQLRQSTPRCSLMECIIVRVIGSMISFYPPFFTFDPVVIVGGVSRMTQQARGA